MDIFFFLNEESLNDFFKREPAAGSGKNLFLDNQS